MRKLLFVIFVSLTFLLSYSAVSMAYENEIKSLSTAMADNIAKAGKKRIAVVDFTDLQGNITELGRFIAEEISVDFTMTAKGFEVIDRNHLNRILAEHKLSVSGIVDLKTVQKLGQITGVDAIVTGSITPLENSVRVVCKVIATDTARVIGAAKGDIAKTKAIEKLLGKGIEIETPGKATSPTSSKLQPKSISLVDMKGFAFEVKGCKMKPDKTVICNIAVINNEEKEKKISISGERGSFLYDNLGNQYKAIKIQFGAKVDNYRIHQSLPPQLPINVFLVFDNVSPQAESVSLRLECGDNGNFYPVLRNIPLSR